MENLIKFLFTKINIFLFLIISEFCAVWLGTVDIQLSNRERVWRRRKQFNMVRWWEIIIKMWNVAEATFAQINIFNLPRYLIQFSEKCLIIRVVARVEPTDYATYNFI